MRQRRGLHAVWKDICERGKGAYVAIPQGGGIKGMSTPFDRRLGEINAELARGILVFGDPTKREADLKKVQRLSRSRRRSPPTASGYLAKEGQVARYDLLDGVRSGRLKLESIPTQQLPADLQKLSPKERVELLARLAEKRGKLLAEARELDRRRGCPHPPRAGQEQGELRRARCCSCSASRRAG